MAKKIAIPEVKILSQQNSKSVSKEVSKSLRKVVVMT